MIRILLVAFVLELMSLAVAQASGDIPSPSNSPSTVAGEVSQIRGNVYIITDKNGNEVRLPIAQDIRFDHVPQIGDWIEAEVSEDGLTRYIRQFPQPLLNPDSITGQGGGTSEGAGPAPQ